MSPSRKKTAGAKKKKAGPAKKKTPAAKKQAPKASPTALREAMLRRVDWRTTAGGNITFPAVPGLVDHYIEVLDKLFTSIGRPFVGDAADRCRGILVEKIAWAFERSANSWVIVNWRTDVGPRMSLSYAVVGQTRTIEESYGEWIQLRQPPLFGKHPDAMVMDLAKTLGSPSEVTVLDAGAGTGRNALPLARAGYVVDAIELAPELVGKLEEAARETNTVVRSVCGSFFDEAVVLPRKHYRLVVLSEMCSHFRGQQDLRNVLTRLSQLLEPGGIGVFNIFLARPGFEPEATHRQFSEIAWCPLYTRKDVEEAGAGLPLALISDESAAGYEKAHLPEGAWPPTGWYERWTSGSELFDLPRGDAPLEMRWLTFRRA